MCLPRVGWGRAAFLLSMGTGKARFWWIFGSFVWIWLSLFLPLFGVESWRLRRSIGLSFFVSIKISWLFELFFAASWLSVGWWFEVEVFDWARLVGGERATVGGRMSVLILLGSFISSIFSSLWRWIIVFPFKRQQWSLRVDPPRHLILENKKKATSTSLKQNSQKQQSHSFFKSK